MQAVSDLQLVIFDCDGVLVDSEAISCGVLASMVSAEGVATTLAQSRRDYQGLRLDEVLAKVEAKLGRPLPEDWLARYERERAATFRRDLNAVPGAAATVARVAAAGVAVCVASQGKLEKTRLTLGLTGPDVRGRGQRALAEVELGDRGRSWPYELSGGEQQRVALARSLVREPAVLLADEPFGALDALTRIRMHGLLKRLSQAHHPAVLLVTHDVDEAIELADRVVVLEDGRIAANLDVRLPQAGPVRDEVDVGKHIACDQHAIGLTKKHDVPIRVARRMDHAEAGHIIAVAHEHHRVAASVAPRLAILPVQF